MPIYEYRCPKCANEFEELLSVESYSPLRVCHKCNTPSPRLISAAYLQNIKKNERIARERNEKAIYEPIRVHKEHRCSDSCNHEHDNKSEKGSYQQIRQGSRPWMLG